MVKVNDPRGDTAAIAMRSLRATNTFKKIKKIIKKYENFDKDKLDFNEDKLDLHKTDKSFYNDFISCTESIKQELIFLWEEVGNLYERLDEYEEQEKQEELPPPPPPKRTSIFGP